MARPQRTPGEDTRVVSFRLPERLAKAVEERAARAGRSLSDEIRALCEGTFRYPGRLYTWAESREREKFVKQIAELHARLAMLEDGSDYRSVAPDGSAESVRLRQGAPSEPVREGVLDRAQREHDRLIHEGTARRLAEGFERERFSVAEQGTEG